MSDFISRMQKRQKEIAARAVQAAKYDDPYSVDYSPPQNQTQIKENLTQLAIEQMEDIRKMSTEISSSLANKMDRNTEAIQKLNLPKHTELSNFSKRLYEQQSHLIADLQSVSKKDQSQIVRDLQEDPDSKGEPVFIQNLQKEKNLKNVGVSKEEKNVEEVKIVEKLLTRANVSGLSNKLKNRVFGQDEVIDEMVNVLKSAYAKLKVNKKKPAGSYFLAGPSGVGKTETARALADALDVPILIINMGEYSLEHDVAKLLGAPPGYLGFEEGGIIPKFIEKNPRCIILFDEVEKAHSSADNILLSIMDQGLCQDNKGNNVYFTQTIIMSTSNIGGRVEYIVNLTQEEKNEARMDAIKEHLRPEIMGRYDSIFHFHSLNSEVYLKIVDKFLGGITQSALEEHKFKLVFSDAIRNLIAEKSYDAALGGRPAGKFIEQVILLPLADFIIADDFEEKLSLNPEMIVDINEHGNIYYHGKDKVSLGELSNTATIIKRIQQKQITEKVKSSNLNFQNESEPVSLTQSILQNPVADNFVPAKPARKMRPQTK